MKLRALFGWGIVIYAVMFLVSSLLAVHPTGPALIARVVLLCTLVITASIAARSVRAFSERDIALYAFGWVACALVFDALLVVPTTGWLLFTDWNVWVGYLVLFFVPIAVTFLSKRTVQTSS